jgi:chromosome segregation ATPase
MWTKATEAYEVLPEKLQIIEMLKKDLEMTRAQNKELNDRIIQLEKLVEMMENRKSSSQVQAPAVSDTRVTELEQSLNNYKRLYNEAQNKYTAAVKEISTLKVSNQKLSTSQVTSSRTTVQTSDGKTKWDTERSNLETEITQIKNHLIGAESYIRELEEQLSNLNMQY